MRDSINNQNFLKEVQRLAKNRFSPEIILRRSNTLGDPKHYHERIFTFPRLQYVKKRHWIELVIAMWYLDDEVLRSQLRLDLEERYQCFEFEDQVELAPLIQDKKTMELYLIETTKWTTKSFFGNILHDNYQLDYFVFLPRLKTGKVKKYTGWCRGPQDHHSARESHQWKPSRSWELNQLQEEIDKEKESLKDITALIEGMLM